MTRSVSRALLVVALFAGATAVPALSAQQSVAASKALLADEHYVRPPADIAALVTAPRQRNSMLGQQSPDRRHFLAVHNEGLGVAAKFGKSHYYLGGLQVDYQADRVRSFTTRGLSAMEIVDATTGRSTAVEIPSGATASSPSWSPDGARLAYFANFDDASYLYVADAATGRARRLTSRRAQPVLSTSLDWAPDGSALYVALVPENRGPAPRAATVADGPLVRVNTGAKLKTRTYASLLNDPYEKSLLEYYGTAQLARVDMRGSVQSVGTPRMIQSVDVSPDGQYLRVAAVRQPFSYVLPVSAFGTTQELWTRDGRLVTTLATRDLPDTDDDISGRSDTDSSRRSFTWLPDGSLAFLQQDRAPKGARGASTADSTDASPSDSARGPRPKDRLYLWRAPFNVADPTALVESDNRIAGFVMGSDGRTVLLSESTNGMAHTYAVTIAQPTVKHTIYRARAAQVGFRGGFGGSARASGDDNSFYANPGTVVLLENGPTLTALMSSDGGSVYLEGTRFARDPLATAPRSFVDRVDVATGRKTRLFESDTALYESNPIPIDNEYTQFVITRETETTVPDQFLRDRSTGNLRQLTHNVDVTSAITRLPRRTITVTRADGKKLYVNVTFPATWREGQRLPAMFWFYPYEYTDQTAYDRTRRTLNKHRYPVANPRSMEIMATQGYAIVQPDMPIFGPTGRMNDNYITDLRNGLTAVIDELDRIGMIDRQRLGLGGHSYGAFSTVNAMVNLPFFKAGIAGDGNYNRAFTPNGFQSERRDLWEARETYLAMSPFLYADRLQGALLMYHSLEDQNVGTDPQNSIRLYHALQGMGKTTALYMYPYEDHGPLMEQTLLDQWGRWVAWLNVYVKNASQSAGAATQAASGETRP